MEASRRIGARLLILLALGAGSEAALAGDEAGERRNAVVANLMFFPNLVLAGLTADCMGTVSVEYQRALGSGLVLTAAPEVVYLSTGIKYAEWKADDSDDFTGWGGGLLLGLRYLFRGEGLTGFYVAAHGGAGWIEGGEGWGWVDASGNMLTFLFDAGYAHTWGSGFTMGFGFGVSARWFVWHKESIETKLIAHPWTRLDIGFAW